METCGLCDKYLLTSELASYKSGSCCIESVLQTLLDLFDEQTLIDFTATNIMMVWKQGKCFSRYLCRNGWGFLSGDWI